LRRQGQRDEAVEHYAALIVLTPTSKTGRAKLWSLVEQTGRYEQYADSLAMAAERCDNPSVAIALLSEAGDVRRDRVQDPRGAADLYESVLERPSVDDATVLSVGRKLRSLLEDEQRLSTLRPPAEVGGGAASIPP